MLSTIFLFFFFVCFDFVFLEIVKDMELSGPFWHEGEAVWGGIISPVCRCLHVLREALCNEEVLLQVGTLLKEAELSHWDAVVSFLSGVH